MVKYVPRIEFDRKLIRKLANATGSDPVIIMRNVENILEAIGDLVESELKFHSWGVSEGNDRNIQKVKVRA